MISYFFNAYLLLCSILIISCEKQTVTKFEKADPILNQTLLLEDSLFIHKGYPAARIYGQVWMRHNLGANYTADPDQLGLIPHNHGNYYQWGRKTAVATGSSIQLSINLLNKNLNLPLDTWNSGTEINPIKTIHDPCPPGYRIPTEHDFTELLNNTSNSDIGTFTNGEEEYGSAKIFSSKNKAHVRLTFPAQGHFTVYNSGPYQIKRRGFAGYYHCSSTFDNRLYYLKFFNINKRFVNDQFLESYNLAEAKNIRCIAE
ncbi:hypothetical protein ACL9RF_05190 [Sphingobacterium sp. Mn56C]|uniref:hypothetical protein n=1 Tax=Sphingobacterium sp. Mn56C TaxID=3395261 RepID=UPI003BD23357